MGRSRHVVRHGSALILTILSAFVGLLSVSAANIGVLVPACFFPGTGGPGGVGDGWASMASAGSTISVTAILNPESGPEPGPANPNYVTAMMNLELAGGKVVACIDTDDGAIPLATVEGEITTYRSQYGNLSFNPISTCPGTACAWPLHFEHLLPHTSPFFVFQESPASPRRISLASAAVISLKEPVVKE